MPRNGLFAIFILLILGTTACEKDNNKAKNPDNQAPKTPINAMDQNIKSDEFFHMSINSDGRYICITTKARLLAADTDDFGDVYRYDRINGQLELISSNLVSHAFTGSISGDGNRIVFTASQSPQTAQSPTAIYLWENGNITALQEGQQDPNSPLPLIQPLVGFFSVISPDGRFVAAHVDNQHLILELANNKVDLVGGGFPTCFSTDGSVHTWLAVDLLSPGKSPAVWVLNRSTGSNLPVTTDTKLSNNPRVSGNGRYVVFASEHGQLQGAEDNNGLMDVFLFDRQSPKYTRLSPVDANGESDFPDISEDGQVIVFTSTANNHGVPDNNLFYDIYARINGQTVNLTPDGDGHSRYAVLSADGRFAAFWSEATNLGGNGPGIYVAGPLR